MAAGQDTAATSRLGALARRSAGEREATLERCELCAAPIAPEHRHLLDLDSRELLCACRACTVLFDRDAAGGRHYRLVKRNLGAMSFHELVYWLAHGREIVDTMAAPYAADVVGLLRDNTSYGVAGDHGGAQRPVQEIPIVFAGGDVGPRDSGYPLRSVDILPTILRKLGIPARPGLDGRAVTLPK